METELLALGIIFKHSRPYHPQTNGKVERFHQTMKKYLEAHDQAETTTELQKQLDRFIDYYNNTRPHRSLGRKTPRSAYEARTKARPSQTPINIDGYRIRHDKVDKAGKVTLRYKSRLHHIGIGPNHTGERIILLTAGPNIRILNADGKLIRTLTIDPNRNYQPQQ